VHQPPRNTIQTGFEPDIETQDIAHNQPLDVINAERDGAK